MNQLLGMGASIGAAAIGAALVLSAMVIASLGLVVALKREWVPVIYNVRSLAVRKTTTIFTLGGLSLVVFVFAMVLMLAAGMKQTMVSTGDPLNAKVIRKGSRNEIQSDVTHEQLPLLAAAPEVAVGDDGRSLSSAELSVLIFVLRDRAVDEADGSNLVVRGVGARALEVHALEELEGRVFTAGTSEILIGKALEGRFKGATLGGTMHFARRDWKVVGVANHGGTAFDSEIWGDVDQLENAFQRRPNSVTLRLKDRAGLAALAERIAGDPRLNSLEAAGEIPYWSAQSEDFALFVTVLGVFFAVIVSLGAVLGAMITMYAQVAARTREIGTLRALGFKRRAVLVSFVLESVLLASLAGVIGLLAAAAMQRISLSTINSQTHSEITFRFHLTPAVVLVSLGFGVLMGYAGGLLPAVRAARRPIARASREG
jgi:putative ABC transport system permease protein